MLQTTNQTAFHGTPDPGPTNQEDARAAVLTELASLLGAHSIGDGSSWHGNQSSANGGSAATPGSALSIATERISKNKNGKFAQSSLFKLIPQHLHRDNNHPTGGAICCFPSLDLHSEETESISSEILPEVGASHKSRGNVSEEEMPPPAAKYGVQIPVMAASVFGESNGNEHGATNVSPQDSSNVSSLQSSTTAATNAASNANANAVKLEQAAARNLGAETKWTPSSVSQAPSALLRSLASSFSSLVDSRVRAWTLLLLRHSLSSGDNQSRSRLLTLLATSNRIDLSAIVTNFKVINVKSSGKKVSYAQSPENPETSSQSHGSQASNGNHTNLNNGNKEIPASSTKSTKSDNLESVLPLILEATIDVIIEGQRLTVNLKAPGVISAVFHEITNKITFVKIKLDTNVLVSSMVEQARLIVFKAVARATSLPATATGLGHIVASKGLPSPINTQNGVASLSGGFGSALNLKASQQSSGLPRQNNSSLRMSSIGKEDSSSNLGSKRKQRSVTWNQPIEDHDSSKRQTGVIKPSMMRSTKSFGKPDASLFESSKNATFGDFGRLNKSNHLPQFVDGKLQVPSNYQNTGNSNSPGLLQRNRGLSMGNILRASNTNATFQSDVPEQQKNATVDRYGLTRNNRDVMSTQSRMSLNKNNGVNIGSQLLGRQTFNQLSRNMSHSSKTLIQSRPSHSQIPRTATALESLLLQASRNK